MTGIDNKTHFEMPQNASLDLHSGIGLERLNAEHPRETESVVDARKDSSIRIAIADSHTIFRDGLRRLLAEEGDLAVVAESSSMTSLFSLLASCRPDVLLLATPLEGLDGPDVFVTLQSAFPLIKVIVMSATGDHEEFVKNVRLGAKGIVQKSTSGPMLVKAIRKVQDGEFWLDRTTTAEVVRHFTEPPKTVAASLKPKPEGKLPMLSRREREIVILVTHGFRNKELAEKLSISEQTVKNHMHNIFDKLGVSDRLELALYAIHNNLHEEKPGG